MNFSLRPLFQQPTVNNFRREMDRLVGDFFGPLAGELQRLVPSGTGYPSLNVWEDNDVLFAEAEVPGLKAEDLDISVIGNQLTVKGRRAAAVVDGGTYHRRERNVGEFVRTVTLPVEIDSDKVEASLADGVLKITLPKAEAAKPRKVTVVRS
jgi:HSP20 family protein